MSTVYNDPIMLDSTGQDIVTKLDSIASLMGDGVIDDTSTATDTTWSSNKITSELAGKQDELTFDHTPKDDSLNPVYSDGIYDSIIGVYDNLELGLGWDSKNILGIANTSKEVNGITFTVNDDGTVKLNGTATSATLYALNKFTGAELKKYGENLLMTGGKDNSTFLTLMTQDWAYTKDDKGNGVEINISELTDATEYTVIIQIANGTTLSNYIMSPMIRLVSIIDPSFKKHHDSANKTIDIKSLGNIKDAVGWSGKNKLPNHLVNVTGDGTVTHNADGTVTLNGTFASTTTVFVLNRTDSEAKNFMKDKRIILSRGVGTTGTTFFMNKYNGDTNVGTVANIQGADYSKSEPFTLDYSDFDSVAVGIYIVANATFNNLKLYPMVIDADCLDLSYEPYFGSTAFPRSEQAVLGAKQLYNIDAPALQLYRVTATKTDNGWHVQTSESTTYPFSSFPVNIPANTDIRFSCGVTINSGSGAISIDGSNDGSSYTAIKQIFNLAANINEVFNSGNYKYYRMRLFANFNETASTDGDILYSNILFTLASDTDRTVVPYAMTNKELTDIANSLTPVLSEATSANTNVTVESSLNSVVRTGNVVSFTVRFTLANATSTSDTELIKLPIPKGTYPQFSIRDRNAPYEEKCDSYLNPGGKLGISGIALPAGTYQVSGCYVAREY